MALFSSSKLRTLSFRWAASLPLVSNLIYASGMVLAVWLGLQLTKPAPFVAESMTTAPSAQFKMDQSAEARLLGVETTGGLTPPSVQVLGVFATTSGQGGAAVLAIEGKPEESVRVGDPVSNGWVLSQVASDHVVLTRTGQRHRVDMPSQNDLPGIERVTAAKPPRT